MANVKRGHRTRARRGIGPEPGWEEWIAPNGKAVSPGLNGHRSAVSDLAYSLWQERGCPYGSPDDDWFRAEAILSSQTSR